MTLTLEGSAINRFELSSSNSSITIVSFNFKGEKRMCSIEKNFTEYSNGTYVCVAYTRTHARTHARMHTHTHTHTHTSGILSCLGTIEKFLLLSPGPNSTIPSAASISLWTENTKHITNNIIHSVSKMYRHMVHVRTYVHTYTCCTYV